MVECRAQSGPERHRGAARHRRAVAKGRNGVPDEIDDRWPACRACAPALADFRLTRLDSTSY